MEIHRSTVSIAMPARLYHDFIVLDILIITNLKSTSPPSKAKVLRPFAVLKVAVQIMLDGE